MYFGSTEVKENGGEALYRHKRAPPEEAEPVETKHATSRTWPHVSESRSLTLVIWCENHTTLKRQVFGCAHRHQTSQPASPERTTVRELLRSGSLLERWKRSGRFRGKYVVNYGPCRLCFPVMTSIKISKLNIWLEVKTIGWILKCA